MNVNDIFKPSKYVRLVVPVVNDDEQASRAIGLRQALNDLFSHAHPDLNDLAKSHQVAIAAHKLHTDTQHIHRDVKYNAWPHQVVQIDGKPHAHVWVRAILPGGPELFGWFNGQRVKIR